MEENDAFEDMFTDDAMSFGEKLQLISVVTETKSKLDLLYEQMLVINNKIATHKYELKNALVVQYVDAFKKSQEKHGPLICELRETVTSIYDRLYECGGNSLVVRELEAEFDAIRPKIRELESHFDANTQLTEMRREQLQRN